MFTLPEHIACQVTAYADRHGITPDEAAGRLVSTGLTAIGGWRLENDSDAYPYTVESTETDLVDGEAVMLPGWTLVQAATTIDEARSILAGVAGVDPGEVAGHPLMMPLRAPLRMGRSSRSVYRIVKAN